MVVVVLLLIWQIWNLRGREREMVYKVKGLLRLGAPYHLSLSLSLEMEMERRSGDTTLLMIRLKIHREERERERKRKTLFWLVCAFLFLFNDREDNRIEHSFLLPLLFVCYI